MPYYDPNQLFYSEYTGQPYYHRRPLFLTNEYTGQPMMQAPTGVGYIGGYGNGYSSGQAAMNMGGLTGQPPFPGPYQEPAYSVGRYETPQGLPYGRYADGNMVTRMANLPIQTQGYGQTLIPQPYAGRLETPQGLPYMRDGYNNFVVNTTSIPIATQPAGAYGQPQNRLPGGGSRSGGLIA